MYQIFVFDDSGVGHPVKGDLQVPRSEVYQFVRGQVSARDYLRIEHALDSKFPRDLTGEIVPLYGTLETLFADNWKAFSPTITREKE